MRFITREFIKIKVQNSAERPKSPTGLRIRRGREVGLVPTVSTYTQPVRRNPHIGIIYISIIEEL